MVALLRRDSICFPDLRLIVRGLIRSNRQSPTQIRDLDRVQDHDLVPSLVRSQIRDRARGHVQDRVRSQSLNQIPIPNRIRISRDRDRIRIPSPIRSGRTRDLSQIRSGQTHDPSLIRSGRIRAPSPIRFSLALDPTPVRSLIRSILSRLNLNRSRDLDQIRVRDPPLDRALKASGLKLHQQSTPTTPVSHDSTLTRAKSGTSHLQSTTRGAGAD
jgi:hypothetical protein